MPSFALTHSSSFLLATHFKGLSHYLEHMLFMGSAKYPNENEYDDYLTKHGGSSNAFTELVSILLGLLRVDVDYSQC